MKAETSDPDTSAFAVTARGLTKTYRLEWRRGRVLALENLDMEVRAGEIFGLLGPNGSGKSTTMKLILGLAKPTAGQVHVFGLPAGSMKARKKLGFLPENPYFPSFLTGRELLRYYGRLVDLRHKELNTRIDELLELVVLQSAASRPLRTYSKGMLQRIGLAQALLHDPELLLLDEPTAGVDPQGSRQIRDLMGALKQRGKTVIFSSHLLEQVEEVSDRVAILHKGVKLREGSIRELLEIPGRVEIRLADSNSGEQAVRQALEKAGIHDAEISRPRMRLEEFFLRTIGDPTPAESNKEPIL